MLLCNCCNGETGYVKNIVSLHQEFQEYDHGL
jgi:hypothetical protein